MAAEQESTVPRVVDHKARRNEVAAAVLRLVARHGLDSVTMRAVAQEAGWSTGVLNHYFGNKQELLVAGLRLAVRDAGERMQFASENCTGPETLEAVLSEGLPLDEWRLALCRIWISFCAQAVGNEDLAARQRRYYSNWRKTVRGVLEEGQRQGWVGSDLDVSAEADSLIALVDGLGLRAVVGADVSAPDQQLGLLKRWLQGIRRLDAVGS
jgi:AcrR family transcriptional regulator